MRCGNCGYIDLSKEAWCCPRCGGDLSIPYVTCQSCKADLSEESVYCYKCGNYLADVINEQSGILPVIAGWPDRCPHCKGTIYLDGKSPDIEPAVTTTHAPPSSQVETLTPPRWLSFCVGVYERHQGWFVVAFIVLVIAALSWLGGTHEYITGPRGGCYYLNSDGTKTYVDHSKCKQQ